MIVEKLKVRDPVKAATIGDLEAEHQGGTRRLRRVAQAVERVLRAIRTSCARMSTTSFATSSTTNGSTWPWRSAKPRQSGLTDPGAERAWPLRQASAPAPLHHRANSAQMLKVGAQVGRDATTLESFADPKEVPLCLTGTVSKICWRFYTGTLRRRLTRSHSIVGALSMAICQWGSKSTVWAAEVSSLPWWKVLEERKKFSMSTTTNTPVPRCALYCPRWAVLVRRYSFLSVSSTLLDRRFSVTRKSRSRYALQGDLALVVRHCWR
jgi:hypothetical protein